MAWIREDVERPRVKVQSHPVGETLTRLSEQKATDIREIMKKYKKTGVVSHINRRAPTYGDFSDATDLHTALLSVESAQAEFERLPSAVRKAADHSPVRLLEMLASESERELLVQAGYDAKHEPGSLPPAPPVQAAAEEAAPAAESSGAAAAS